MQDCGSGCLHILAIAARTLEMNYDSVCTTRVCLLHNLRSGIKNKVVRTESQNRATETRDHVTKAQDREIKDRRARNITASQTEFGK